NVKVAKDSHKDKFRKFTEYQGRYLDKEIEYNGSEFGRLEADVSTAQQYWMESESRLKEAERIFDSIKGERTAFQNGSIETKISLVDRLRKIAVKNKLDAIDDKNPFRSGS